MSTTPPPFRALLELIKHVYRSKGYPSPITYKELAFRIGRLTRHGEGHAHGMGIVLGDMGHALEALEGEWGETIPHIQSLVVSSRTGVPDDGISAFWPDYESLSKPEKQAKAAIEYEKIAAYGSRWNQVLRKLKLPAITPRKISDKLHAGTGESDAHKALKEYVKRHPSLLGVARETPGILEYPLPSGDTIDVLFKEENRWIAVEVKSAVSHAVAGDYVRGVYQCVKYRAVLQAMHFDDSLDAPEDIEAILVTEKKLPDTPTSLLDELKIAHKRVTISKGKRTRKPA